MTNSEEQKEKQKQLEEILKYSHQEVSDESQRILNKPVVTAEILDQADQDFLDLVMNLIEKKTIDLYKPSSLINDPVYQTLTADAKSQAELEALNLLNTLREIYKLYNKKLTDTYQFKNKLHQFRLTKERIEEEAGDIFII